jgi:adiponectin receptor
MFYIIGLVFYAFHFPECVFPGKFDYAYSHTLWHIFIIMAIRAHYMSLVVLKAHSASFSAVGL